VIIDEFQNCTSKNEKGFNRTLFGGRKFKVPWTYSHQSLSQVSEELTDALENTARFCFAMGQRDAMYYAPILGGFDPLNIKHDVPDENARDRTHPERYKLNEIKHQWVTELKTLPIRTCYTRIENRTQKIRSLRHLPHTTPYAEVQKLIQQYTTALMTPLASVKREVDGITETAPLTSPKLLPAPRLLLEGRIRRQRTLEEF
jgi:hypothetical protein